MDLELAGKRALITGSSSGIGAGVARMLAAEGCIVVVHGRDRARAEEVAHAMGAASVAIGDLATDEGADLVVEVVRGNVGGIDILVNNAGGAAGTSALSWLDVDEAGWQATYQSNAVAAARMIRRLVPGMIAQNFGRVIQIASAAATQPIAFGPDYGAAKGAMLNLTVSLAKSLAGTGVTSNSISPGMVMTPSLERWFHGLAESQGWNARDLAAIEARVTRELTPIPVGRVGRPEDIGFAVCMLASPKSGYITGANIRVDGGQVQSVN